MGLSNMDAKVKALGMWKAGQNATCIASHIGVSRATTSRWIAKWKKGDFSVNGTEDATMLQNVATACDEKKKEIAENFSNEFMIQTRENLSKLNDLLSRRIDKALNNQEMFDELVETIYSTSDKEMNRDQKAFLVSKIKGLTMANTKDLAIMIGTLYDKQALANKDDTGSNTMPNKLEISFIDAGKNDDSEN